VRRVLLAALVAVSAPCGAEPPDRWAAEVAEASSRFDVPAEWIRRVIGVESGGRLRLHGRPVVSRAGAMGLMQLMPATWRDMRLMFGLGPDPFDPRDNILAGTAYLRLMYDRFGYPGLFGAYNAGPGRYGAFLAGHPLPGETRAYVASLERDTPPPPNALARRRASALFVPAPPGEGAREAVGAGRAPPMQGLFVDLGADRFR
jgi:soluble lytic murein transglycosylase-like protein